MKTFAWFCVALAMALVLITAPAQAAKEIKVGIVDCYSGPPATYTNDVRDAFKTGGRQDQCRRRGSGPQDRLHHPGQQVQGRYRPVGRQGTDLPGERGHPDGHDQQRPGPGHLRYVQKEKVPFFATFSKSAKITGAKGHRYVFSVTENTALVGKAGAAGLAKRLIKNTGSPATITSTAMPWPTACGTTSKSCVRTWNCWASPGGKSASPISPPISRPSCRPSLTRSSSPRAGATACPFSRPPRPPVSTSARPSSCTRPPSCPP
jgi:hypothetical protein